VGVIVGPGSCCSLRRKCPRSRATVCTGAIAASGSRPFAEAATAASATVAANVPSRHGVRPIERRIGGTRRPLEVACSTERDRLGIELVASAAKLA